MEAIPITINGAKSLELELLRLKDEERPRDFAPLIVIGIASILLLVNRL
jgi:hypothetical protein